jgi:hypothetical protein
MGVVVIDSEDALQIGNYIADEAERQKKELDKLARNPMDLGESSEGLRKEIDRISSLSQYFLMKGIPKGENAIIDAGKAGEAILVLGNMLLEEVNRVQEIMRSKKLEIVPENYKYWQHARHLNHYINDLAVPIQEAPGKV